MSGSVLGAATDVVLLRALFLGGALVVIGGGAVAVLIDDDTGRIRRNVLPVSWVVAAVGALLSTEHLRSTLGVRFADLADGPAGQAALLRATALALCIVALGAAALRPRRARRALAAATLSAVGAIVGHAAGGHARTGSLAAVSVVIQALHIGAAGAWLGGLTALVMAPAATVDRGLRRFRRFSRLAAAGLVTLVVTGVLRSLDEIGSFDGLIATTYGRLVVLKSLLLLALSGIGLRNRNALLDRRSARGSGVRRLHRWATVEVALALVVVVATAVLTETAPPGSAPNAAAAS